MKYVLLLVMLLGTGVFGQGVRSLNNEGVALYKQKKFTDAEVNFRKGIEKDTANFQAAYNLGSAYYKQKKYEDAVKAYKNALPKTTDRAMQAKTWYNTGNALLDGNKLEEAVEAYKQSLRLNPADQDAKYNLSYALEKLKNKNNQNKNNQNQNKDNKNQNKDNQDQNKDNKDKQDNKDNNKQDNKDGQDKQDKQDNQSGNQGNPKISKDEAERVLEAMKNNEKDLQKKLRKKEGARVKIEKDW